MLSQLIDTTDANCLKTFIDHDALEKYFTLNKDTQKQLQLTTYTEDDKKKHITITRIADNILGFCSGNIVGLNQPSTSMYDIAKVASEIPNLPSNVLTALNSSIDKYNQDPWTWNKVAHVRPSIQPSDDLPAGLLKELKYLLNRSKYKLITVSGKENQIIETRIAILESMIKGEPSNRSSENFNDAITSLINSADSWTRPLVQKILEEAPDFDVDEYNRNKPAWKTTLTRGHLSAKLSRKPHSYNSIGEVSSTSLIINVVISHLNC